LKLAVTSKEKDLNSSISPIFGKSPYLILVDLDENEIKRFKAIENPVKYEKGSGNLLAQLIVENEIESVICGEMGPVAFLILKGAGIKVYKFAPMNVEKNITRFMDNKLNKITSLASGYPK
jgi:predicted Fe-Mo cluster-binding NifX family protein